MDIGSYFYTGSYLCRILLSCLSGDKLLAITDIHLTSLHLLNLLTQHVVNLAILHHGCVNHPNSVGYLLVSKGYPGKNLLILTLGIHIATRNDRVVERQLDALGCSKILKVDGYRALAGGTARQSYLICQDINAVGDIYDFETGRKVAGLRADDGKTFLDSERVLMQQLDAPQEKFVGNTTLGILFTNAKLDKAQLCKAAGMAHDGYARAIRPVHTSMDGDSIYAVSLGDVPADLDAVGVIGARVMAKAIVRAVEAADSAYGFPAARDL